MNIVEVYGIYEKQLIILVSGLSGSNKTEIAKNICEDFKLDFVNLTKFCKKEFNLTFELSNGMVIRDWDHVDSYDWKQLNEYVKKNEKKLLVICGDMFPTDKLEFKPNFHIHIKISKEKLFENRHKFIEKNPEKCSELHKFLDTDTEKLIIDELVWKHYNEYLELSNTKTIKFFNTNKLTYDDINKGIFEYIINNIGKYIKDNHEKIDKIVSKKSNKKTNKEKMKKIIQNFKDEQNKSSESSDYSDSYSDSDTLSSSTPSTPDTNTSSE
jgi:uridine kinase